jgi:hypothetical protein
VEKVFVVYSWIQNLIPWKLSRNSKSQGEGEIVWGRNKSAHSHGPAPVEKIFVYSNYGFESLTNKVKPAMTRVEVTLRVLRLWP